MGILVILQGGTLPQSKMANGTEIRASGTIVTPEPLKNALTSKRRAYFLRHSTNHANHRIFLLEIR